MNNLQQLDEALNFLNDENKSEVIEEGFFSKLKSLFNKGGEQKEKLPEYTYYVSSVEKSVGTTVKTTRNDKSVSNTIDILAGILYDYIGANLWKKATLSLKFYLYSS